MIRKEVRETIKEISPDAVILDNPEFDNSIIGLSIDGRIIYDLELMIQELMEDDGMSEEEARDFVDHNTIPALAFMGEISPIILDSGSALSAEL